MLNGYRFGPAFWIMPRDTADKADTMHSEYALRIEIFLPPQWNPHPWSWLPVTIPTSLPSLVLSEPLNYLYTNVHTGLERWRLVARL